ncbi:MAG: tRNA (adenosine(37)-N6)-threonylcarbamoyltransferase complex ATPase subunit type 1 TsaE [Pirellulaceae bacterium]|nr:tRNA (adenosine(37)-N6)-threonylcarbamoyltransferase complex ATPase subunit type 1 TsaE [Pirellulaceae bacterium]
MDGSLTINLPDLSATKRIAEQIAALSQPPLTIALVGTLGAGKTQWVRYFAAACGVSEQCVSSPTYVLLQRYMGRDCSIYHLDFYRLDYEAQVWDLGLDELQEQAVLILVEWADKFPQTLPGDRLELRFSLLPNDTRRIELLSHGKRSAELLRALQAP